MEQVVTDESALETELKSYEDQLEIVEQQLQVSGQEDDESLMQLKADLAELIGLTQDNLAEVKKRKLLLTLEGSDFSESLQDTSTNDNTSNTDTDDLSGTKCRAPLKESWGAVNYHNAIVVCTEDNDGEEVRVMFTHPTYNKMKPCSYFLDGMCKFDEDACKFSHGTVVLYSDCQPYNEADLNKVGLERKCLAKHVDGLWHPAIISTVEPGASTVGIHYTDTKEDVDLELDSVYPLDSSSDSSSSEEQEDEIDDDDEVVKVISSTAGATALGYWEEHTNGIGSKLLQKMGYVYGKGLGKNGEGRVEPVEIVILPNGLSLDACAQLKESKKLRTVGEQPSKHRRRRKRKQAMQKAANATEPKDETHFFNFLDKTLQSQKKVSNNTENDTKAQVTKMSGHNLNVELFKLDEDKKVIEKKIQSLESALQRHRGRDKQMESHVKSKLQEAQKTLKQLQDRETLLQTKASQNKNKHKLTIF